MNHPCPACEAPISEETIRGRGVAPCASCGATVRFEREGEAWRVTGYTGVAPPEGITVHVDEPPTRTTEGYRDATSTRGRFEASRRWWTPSVLFLTLFAFIWDAFLVFWYANAIGFGGRMGAFSIIMFVFPLIHVAVGIGLTWHVLATWLNRTTIRIEGGQLASTSGPIPVPWRRAHAVSLSEVDYFEPKQASARFRRNTMTPAQWNVVARTREGRDIVTVAGVPEELARFLARRFERHLA